MYRYTLILFLLATIGVLPAKAASVLIQVDQSAQRMKVSVDGVSKYDWRVSTGRPGNDTPNGKYRPNRLDADHHSDEYDGAPMPYAIFFDLKGHAIHGTYEKIGKPGASHGCVRLEPTNAKKLFELVQAEGLSRVSVVIGGDVKFALGASTPKKRLATPRRSDPLQDSDFDPLSYPTTLPLEDYRGGYSRW